MDDPLIIRRLDAGLARAADLGAAVRAIYLTEADHALLTRCNTRIWRKRLGSRATFTPLSYRDAPIRRGKRTLIYTEHGVGVTVPRRV